MASLFLLDIQGDAFEKKSRNPMFQGSKRCKVTEVGIDLIKGASGQAIQNMNPMSGLLEGAGLPLVALYP
jgi:N-acetyl-gamma-glutamylphosphate reductase